MLAERGHFDIAKEIFTHTQEVAAGNIFVQMLDVWVNLAHVYFAQGQFGLAVKMYQNCLRKFYFGTDTQILLYFVQVKRLYPAKAIIEYMPKLSIIISVITQRLLLFLA